MKKHPEDRIQHAVEWVVEPTDENGDIIDPLFHDTKPQALQTLGDPGFWKQFPSAVYADFARVRRTGSDSEGELDREYEYRTRHYRDGRVVELETTDDGLSPKTKEA